MAIQTIAIDTEQWAVVPMEFIGLFEDAFSFLANGHSIGQCFDMMKFARTTLLKSQKNQCDGCMAGHELVDGKHYKGNMPYMVCQKHRYAAAPRPEAVRQPATICKECVGTGYTSSVYKGRVRCALCNGQHAEPDGGAV